MTKEDYIAISKLMAQGKWHRLRDWKDQLVDDVRSCKFCGLLESDWESTVPCVGREDSTVRYPRIDRSTVIEYFHNLQQAVDGVEDFETLLYVHGFLLGWSERVEAQLKKAERKRIELRSER